VHALPPGDDEGNDDGEGGDCYAKAFAQAKAKASASGYGNAKAEAKVKAEAEAKAKCKSEDEGNDDRRRSLLSGECGMDLLWTSSASFFGRNCPAVLS